MDIIKLDNKNKNGEEERVDLNKETILTENKGNKDIITKNFKDILPPRLKIRLLEAIEKGRKTLSINKDTTITVESFYNDIDLECHITKEEFEEIIIKEEVECFTKYLNEFKGLIDKRLLNNLTIEMAGELMRTPILQNKVSKCFNNISISKGILIDECASVGAALYGYYINDKLPISTFKNMFGFNYYQFIVNLKK